MRIHRSRAIAVVLAVLASATSAFSVRGAECAALSNMKLPDTTVGAQSVSAGKFVPPYGRPIDMLPAFCRVAGVIRPSRDSYIRFEVWMPTAGWNGKFLAAGNGGFAGSINYGQMAGDLRRGYATAGTDTGHEADAVDASWAYQHPEKVLDFGYRALHETAQDAKKLIEAFYGKAPQRSYFDSCSNGGREGLIEAQRFPEDFDGILAGAPANFWSHLLTAGVDISKAMYGNNPAGYISSIKIPAIQAAALAVCDAQDGLKDGIVGDPLRCHFDPSVLLCKGEDSPNCLTAPQVASLKKLYQGARNSHGEQIFPGFFPGAEQGPNGWSSWITGSGPGQASGPVYSENYFRYMVFGEPTWNLLTADVDVAEHAADEKTAHILNATDPNLRNFQTRGGKLVLYHGWNDPAISPLNSINYYQQVQATMGAATARNFLRLYMVPGMQHCFLGPGPNSFGQAGHGTAKGPEYGIYDALEQWVEKGNAPGEIIATKYVEDTAAKGTQMTRPLCPYPEISKYKGSGDANEYTSFACSSP